MKKIIGKNQLIITALAIMIVVAGYLNFTGQEISTSGLVASQNKENMNAAKERVKAEQKKAEAVSKEEKKAKKLAKKKGVETSAKAQKEAKTDISAEDEVAGDYTVNDEGEVVATKEEPGKAVMVSNHLSSDYFSAAKLSREQSRAKNKATLMEIINNKELSKGEKKVAVKEVALLTRNAEAENAAELMLEAKGFTDAVVSISDKKADVVINANKLSSQEMVQIQDIVKRKANIKAENIVITPVSVKENSTK